jgi:hypothetical protein
MSIRKHVSFMLYLFSSFDGIIINITTDILNESYTSILCAWSLRTATMEKLTPLAPGMSIYLSVDDTVNVTQFSPF